MAIETVNGVLAATVPKLGGEMNLDEGMFLEDAIMPIGAGLQEPVLICLPFVIGKLTVAQMFMKLLCEVRDGD